jgi:hypothetical protein
MRTLPLSRKSHFWLSAAGLSPISFAGLSSAGKLTVAAPIHIKASANRPTKREYRSRNIVFCLSE